MLQPLSRHDPLLQPVSRYYATLDGRERALVSTLILMSLLAMVFPPYYGYRYRGNFWCGLTVHAITLLSPNHTCTNAQGCHVWIERCDDVHHARCAHLRRCISSMGVH